jgi:alcohol dehydrogenase (NADP+)
MVAPLLISGVTVVSPLTWNGVGVGVGGLGHYAIMFANALGAEVTTLSHSAKKKHDAIQMGAKHFVDTSQEGWAISKRNLDSIICTSFAKDMPLKEYIGLLDIGGTFVYVGIPESDLPPLPPTLMIGTNTALQGLNSDERMLRCGERNYTPARLDIDMC